MNSKKQNLQLKFVKIVEHIGGIQDMMKQNIKITSIDYQKLFV